MVLMVSKWPGKCKRCGKPILTGETIDWEKGVKGAVHPTPEACESAAAELAPLRGPQPEDPEEQMIVVECLLPARWHTATSARYKDLPHQYTLRKWWPEDDFVWCVEYIRRVGYEKRFIGRVWTYYDIGEHLYWDCGGPVADVGLINRAVRK